ncbi:MAG: hypothetical protein R2795_15335 [Saprospiraceae bacterium]
MWLKTWQTLYLDTTAAFLHGEVEDMELPRYAQTPQRHQQPAQERQGGILFALDGLLRDAKTRLAYQ